MASRKLLHLSLGFFFYFLCSEQHHLCARLNWMIFVLGSLCCKGYSVWFQHYMRVGQELTAVRITYLHFLSGNIVRNFYICSFLWVNWDILQVTKHSQSSTSLTKDYLLMEYINKIMMAITETEEGLVIQKYGCKDGGHVTNATPSTQYWTLSLTRK